MLDVAKYGCIVYLHSYDQEPKTIINHQHFDEMIVAKSAYQVEFFLHTGMNQVLFHAGMNQI